MLPAEDLELHRERNASRIGRRTVDEPRISRQRARCYQIVLREGAPADLLQYVDGALLIDLWPELVLPRDLRAAWQPVIDSLMP